MSSAPLKPSLHLLLALFFTSSVPWYELSVTEPEEVSMDYKYGDVATLVPS